MVSYNITSLGLSGEIPIQRIVSDNVALCENLLDSEPMSCDRAQRDQSHGEDDPPVLQGGGTLPNDEIFDAGPGPEKAYDDSRPAPWPTVRSEPGAAGQRIVRRQPLTLRRVDLMT